MVEQANKRQYLFVVRELTSREIKRRYSRSKLGIIWSVLNPLLTMAVLSLIFSQIFKRSIENFPIYYLSGYILWQLFTNSTNAAMTALVDNKMMLIKVKFPMEIFVLARVYTSLINFCYSLIAYGIMLFVFRVAIKPAIIFAPIIILLLLLFSLGIAYLLATVYVFFGDIKYLYSVVLTMWMYMSALFYPVNQLGGLIKTVIYCNPIYAYISSMRNVVLDGSMPSIMQILQMLLWGTLMYLTGRFIFQNHKNIIMQRI